MMRNVNKDIGVEGDWVNCTQKIRLYKGHKIHCWMRIALVCKVDGPGEGKRGKAYGGLYNFQKKCAEYLLNLLFSEATKE